MSVDNVSDIGASPDAFEAFYRENVEDVQRFVSRRVSDPHDAADLTAEVFLAVIESAQAYRPGAGPPRAWLFGIARNVVAMEHRRRVHRLTVMGRVIGQRVLEPDAMERAVERIDAQQEARRLHARLSELSPPLCAVVELVVIDELSVIEAATVLGISAGTARARLHRSRKKIAETSTSGHYCTLSTEASP